MIAWGYQGIRGPMGFRNPSSVPNPLVESPLSTYDYAMDLEPRASIIDNFRNILGSLLIETFFAIM